MQPLVWDIALTQALLRWLGYGSGQGAALYLWCKLLVRIALSSFHSCYSNAWRSLRVCKPHAWDPRCVSLMRCLAPRALRGIWICRLTRGLIAGPFWFFSVSFYFSSVTLPRRSTLINAYQYNISRLNFQFCVYGGKWIMIIIDLKKSTLINIFE